jgi:L-seryl-tRNA(Ser) seleniumtransferase
MTQPLLRHLPSVDRWLDSVPARALVAAFSRAEVRDAVRTELQSWRGRIRAGETAIPDFFSDAFLATVRAALTATRTTTLGPVVNATGIVLHTNLGRAPLAAEAIAATQAVAAGYSSLEYDLASGARGARNDHVESLLTRLTGAEAALVVNNGAAALLLALTAIADDHEVVISRGELIEIGGSFRMPDVIAQSGARMVEVGTTNRTTLDDYENAMTPATRVILQSHPSNYRIVGFTAQPRHADLAALARKHGCVSILDLGSGCIVDLAAHGLPSEPTVSACLTENIDLVTFSGDKLLGGPQAGIVAGKSEYINRLRRHPMARAVRIDKLSLAALAATLQLYLPPHDPFERIPVLRMLAEPIESLAARADALCARCAAIDDIDANVVATSGYAGGGSLPINGIESAAAAVRCRSASPDALIELLRRASPPIVARISDDAVLFDVRTMSDADCEHVATVLGTLLKPRVSVDDE